MAKGAGLLNLFPSGEAWVQNRLTIFVVWEFPSPSAQGDRMYIVTTETVAGKKTKKTIGLVKGNTVKAKNIGRDLVAGIRNIVGGEVDEYTKLLTEARELAIKRMEKEAKKKGANAIVGVRVTTSQIAQAASEVLVYGTAVVVQ